MERKMCILLKAHRGFSRVQSVLFLSIALFLSSIFSFSLSLSFTSLVRFLSFNFFQDKRNSWLLIWLLLLWIFIFNSLSNFLLQFLDCHSIRKGMNWMCSKCYIIVSASLSFILFLSLFFSSSFPSISLLLRSSLNEWPFTWVKGMKRGEMKKGWRKKKG